MELIIPAFVHDAFREMRLKGSAKSSLVSATMPGVPTMEKDLPTHDRIGPSSRINRATRTLAAMQPSRKKPLTRHTAGNLPTATNAQNRPVQPPFSPPCHWRPNRRLPYRRQAQPRNFTDSLPGASSEKPPSSPFIWPGHGEATMSLAPLSLKTWRFVSRGDAAGPQLEWHLEPEAWPPLPRNKSTPAPNMHQ